MDLQNSVNEQTTTLGRLRTSLASDISVQGQKLVETQESILLAVSKAINGGRSRVYDNLIDLGQRLDDVGRRVADSSSELRDVLDDQRTTLQACQMHLEHLQEAAGDIDRGSKQEGPKSFSGNWLEHLKSAGLTIAALAGVSNMLAIQTLRDEGFARMPQQSQDRLQAGFNVPVGKKDRRWSTTPSDPPPRSLDSPGGVNSFPWPAFLESKEVESSDEKVDGPKKELGGVEGPQGVVDNWLTKFPEFTAVAVDGSKGQNHQAFRFPPDRKVTSWYCHGNCTRPGPWPFGFQECRNCGHMYCHDCILEVLSHKASKSPSRQPTLTYRK